jgi:hypothetical protein
MPEHSKRAIGVAKLHCFVYAPARHRIDKGAISGCEFVGTFRIDGCAGVRLHLRARLRARDIAGLLRLQPQLC